MPIFSSDLLQKVQSNDPTITELICSQVKGVTLTMQEVEAISSVLQNNTHIETISLLGNPINVNSAQLLAQFFTKNTRLKKIYLGTCELGSNVSMIMESLEYHPSVSILDLNTNNLSDKEVLSLVSLLKKNTTLEELEVGNNQFTATAYQHMKEALEDNQVLACQLDFCSTPEQYFASPEKNVINEIHALCEEMKRRSNYKM